MTTMQLTGHQEFIEFGCSIAHSSRETTGSSHLALSSPRDLSGPIKTGDEIEQKVYEFSHDRNENDSNLERYPILPGHAPIR
jgi:hypothetical protein